MPWKAVAIWACVALLIAAGAAFALRKAPVAALDGVWETADQESVLYVDTKARTITYEGPAPVFTKTEVYSSSAPGSGPVRTSEGWTTRNTTLKLYQVRITPTPGAAFTIAFEDRGGDDTSFAAKLRGRNGLQVRYSGKGSLKGLARSYRRQ